MDLETTRVVIMGLGVTIALVTYITNSFYNYRNKNIENIERFLKAHEELFDKEGYLYSHIQDMEKSTFKRDQDNPEMEQKFNRLLGGIEKIALLTSHKAVPTSVQVYMFGWFAKKIKPVITQDERDNLFWELAVSYIDELVKATDDYEKLSTDKREKLLKKNAFSYKKFKS